MLTSPRFLYAGLGLREDGQAPRFADRPLKAAVPPASAAEPAASPATKQLEWGQPVRNKYFKNTIKTDIFFS